MRQHLRIIACTFFATLFFGETFAQETRYVELQTCAEKATQNDPSILSRKAVDARATCADGYPAAIVVVDTWYGFETAAKTVHGLPSEARVITPTLTDVYATHKPCRVAYPKLGVFIEWLVGQREACDGRPAGSYYRVYTPKEEVCIKPGGGCIAVSKLDELGQRRYRETLRIAYEGY